VDSLTPEAVALSTRPAGFCSSVSVRTTANDKAPKSPSRRIEILRRVDAQLTLPLRGRFEEPEFCLAGTPLVLELDSHSAAGSATRCLSTSDVKRRKARLAPEWGTAREFLRVLSAFARPLVPALEISFLCIMGREIGWRLASKCRVPFPRPLPQLAPGRGTAREVLKVKSAFARPYLVELRWVRAASSRLLAGGGGGLRGSAHYALLPRLGGTEVGCKMSFPQSDEYTWHRSHFGAGHNFGLLRSLKPFAEQGENTCKHGHCSVRQSRSLELLRAVANAMRFCGALGWARMRAASPHHGSGKYSQKGALIGLG